MLENFSRAEITLYYLFRTYPTLLYTLYGKDSTPFIFKTFIEVRRFYNRERIASRGYNYPPDFIEALRKPTNYDEIEAEDFQEYKISEDKTATL